MTTTTAQGTPPLDFTALFPFCGLGAGARGFLDAEVTLFGRRARFRSLGGLDIDAESCADFETLTKSPALCADIATLTVEQLRAFAGEVAPDVVFGSPPCKGFSGLLSKKSAEKPKYEALNRLVVRWVELVLEAWGDAPPRLLLLENVPRIASRGRPLLKRVKKLLRAAGYLFDERTHDCGELGGLAQHRRRFLLVARHAKRCPPILFEPPAKRVRACGEVLEQLPLPGDPRAGELHQLPRISWLNWVRLALIPPGGDWRDLPGVLEDGQARREVHKRHEVATWTEPTGTIAGSGSNGVTSVADPRVALSDNPNRHRNKYAVGAWEAPAPTVIGATRPGSGAPSIADPRLSFEGAEYHRGVYGVLAWEKTAPTITGAAKASSGRFSVADPRVRTAYDHGYRVLRWSEPSFTVAGQTSPGCGAYQVADPRIVGEPPSIEQLLAAFDGDPKKPPPFVPVIPSPHGGAWHRPLTTLELALLQGLPAVVDGAPLTLAGRSVARWRERIGNAVPVQAAEAIATQMLATLVHAEIEAWSLASSATPVWVDRDVTPSHVEALHA